MPPRNRRRRKSDRRPNVYVQTEQPTGRRQDPEQSSAPSPVLSATAAAVQTQQSAPRRTQRTRSEVYARTFPREIRKIGILAAGIVIALAAFTVIL